MAHDMAAVDIRPVTLLYRESQEPQLQVSVGRWCRQVIPVFCLLCEL